MDRHIFLFLFQTILSSSTRRKIAIMWWMFSIKLPGLETRSRQDKQLNVPTPSTVSTSTNGLLAHTCLVLTVSRLAAARRHTILDTKPHRTTCFGKCFPLTVRDMVWSLRSDGLSMRFGPTSRFGADRDGKDSCTRYTSAPALFDVPDMCCDGLGRNGMG